MSKKNLKVLLVVIMFVVLGLSVMNFTAVEVSAAPNSRVNTTFFPAIEDCIPPKSNCINNWGIEV